MFKGLGKNGSHAASPLGNFPSYRACKGNALGGQKFENKTGEKAKQAGKGAVFRIYFLAWLNRAGRTPTQGISEKTAEEEYNLGKDHLTEERGVDENTTNNRQSFFQPLFGGPPLQETKGL